MFPLSKWHAAWLAAAVTVSIAAGAAVQFRRAARPDGPISVTRVPASGRPMQAAAAGTALPSRRGPLYVHVSGQVAHPGLYRLPAGARVMDAVTGAGGATGNANLDALNLATPLRDGQKLVVPGLGETPGSEPDYIVDSPPPPAAAPVLVRADPPPARTPDFAPSDTYGAGGLSVRPAWTGSVAAPAAPNSAKLKNPGDGVVNINTAGERELQRLPGVGPSTARKILDYRSAHGGFRTVEELMEVKGIGEAKLAKMAPFVVL